VFFKYRCRTSKTWLTRAKKNLIWFFFSLLLSMHSWVTANCCQSTLSTSSNYSTWLSVACLTRANSIVTQLVTSSIDWTTSLTFPKIIWTAATPTLVLSDSTCSRLSTNMTFLRAGTPLRPAWKAISNRIYELFFSWFVSWFGSSFIYSTSVQTALIINKWSFNVCWFIITFCKTDINEVFNFK